MNATLTFVAFKLRPIQTSVGALPFKTTQYRHSGAFNFKASNMMPLKAESTTIKIFADKHGENAQSWLSYIKTLLWKTKFFWKIGSSCLNITLTSASIYLTRTSRLV